MKNVRFRKWMLLKFSSCFSGTNRPKRFMCSSCGYTCDQRHKLEVHERVHTDERPFDCQFCDKKFREKGTLVRHIRTHTGEKPYSCNICGTAYAARDTYVQHYKRKHEPRPDGSTEPRPRYYNCIFIFSFGLIVLYYYSSGNGWMD